MRRPSTVFGQAAAYGAYLPEETPGKLRVIGDIIRETRAHEGPWIPQKIKTNLQSAAEKILDKLRSASGLGEAAAKMQIEVEGQVGPVYGTLYQRVYQPDPPSGLHCEHGPEKPTDITQY